MCFSEKDKERIETSIACLKAFIDEKIAEQRKISELIVRTRLELACLEHCYEEVR